jgi:hypothetical protein
MRTSAAPASSARSSSTPEFVWDMSTFRGWPEAQAYSGVAGAREFMADWVSAWDAWELEVEALHDAGDKVVAILRSKSTGLPVENELRPGLDVPRRQAAPDAGLRRSRRGDAGKRPGALTLEEGADLDRSLDASRGADHLAGRGSARGGRVSVGHRVCSSSVLDIT